MNICMTGHVYALPPVKYAGVERVVTWWVRELRKRGHRVALVANADSTLECERLIPKNDLNADAFVEGMERARRGDFAADVVHDNNDCHAPHPSRFAAPYIYTVHACVWNGNPNPVFLSYQQAKWHKYPGFPMVVNNGLPADEYPMGVARQGYALWLASLRTCKAPEMAIAACEEAGVPLKIVGPIQDGRYSDFPRRYPPGGQIEYLGEMGSERLRLFREASVFLYTCDQAWMEGFNLTNIEAMLSGTPVVALRTGNNRIADEQIVNGVSGVVCDSYEDIVAALKARVWQRMPPESVRACATSRFTVERTVDRYLELYESAVRGKRW